MAISNVHHKTPTEKTISIPLLQSDERNIFYGAKVSQKAPASKAIREPMQAKHMAQSIQVCISCNRNCRS
jgi:hypothetical protein